MDTSRFAETSHTFDAWETPECAKSICVEVNYGSPSSTDRYRRRDRLTISKNLVINLLVLHFAWGVADAKGIVVTAVCVSVCVFLSVCLYLTAFPQYYTDPDVTWGMVGVPSGCALLGGFAIGARVSLLWQHSIEREMSASACTRSMPSYLITMWLLLLVVILSYYFISFYCFYVI